MKLPRPYIPLAVRVQVAEWQVAKAGFVHLLTLDGQDKKPLRERLGDATEFMFGDQKVHLDHDPALVNRSLNKRTGKYTPDANDPFYLVYRTKAEHDIKTRIHGDGAQHSDLGLRRKLKRIARNRTKTKSKSRFQSRPFPNGRKTWPSRPMTRKR